MKPEIDTIQEAIMKKPIDVNPDLGLLRATQLTLCKQTTLLQAYRTALIDIRSLSACINATGMTIPDQALLKTIPTIANNALTLIYKESEEGI